MPTLLEKFKGLTKYWWATLIVGLAIIAVGVLVFFYPGEAYVGLSVIFAILMLVSGILELAIAFSEKYISGRGWLAASGAIELILGIILLVFPAISAMMLPLLLGFWLMFRGVSMIGLASEMRTLKVSGMGWTIALGILLILCSVVVLLQPLMIGTVAIVVIVGISLLIAGIGMCVLAFELMNLRKKYNKLVK